MDSDTVVRLDVPGRIEVLETADALVARLADAIEIDIDSRQDILVALHESLVNAIVHGNRGDEARSVVLRLAIDADVLEIRVADEGQGFDPTGVPDPLAPENLAKSSGRGILMMRTVMDGVTFRRLPGGGTEVTMRKRLPRRSRVDSRGIVADR